LNRCQGVSFQAVLTGRHAVEPIGRMAIHRKRPSTAPWARAHAAWESARVRQKQVYRGSLRWLKPAEGGLRQPFTSDHWCRPAWVEPGDIQHVASLAITGIKPGEPVSADVEASWLFWENLPEDEWTVRPGDVLAVTEGSRAVAYMIVEQVKLEAG